MAELLQIIETLAPVFCWGLLCLWALPTPVLRQEGREKSWVLLSLLKG